MRLGINDGDAKREFALGSVEGVFLLIVLLFSNADDFILLPSFESETEVFPFFEF